MKVNYGTLSVLLLILLLACGIMVIQMRQNNDVNNILHGNSNLIPLLDVQENFFDLNPLSDFILQKISVSPEEESIKFIKIEGKNLHKLYDVYFGNNIGFIKDQEGVTNSTPDLQVYPPNLMEYEKDSESEIKLLIQRKDTKETLQVTNFNMASGTQSIDVPSRFKLTVELTNVTLRIEKDAPTSSGVDYEASPAPAGSSYNIKINGNEEEISMEEDLEKEYILPGSDNSLEFSLEDAENFYNFDIKITVESFVQEDKILLPTGIFYMTKKSPVYNPNNWYIQVRNLDAIKNLGDVGLDLGEEAEQPAPTPQDLEDFDIKNLKIAYLDKERQVKLSWDVPDGLLYADRKDNLEYHIDFKPKVPNDMETVNISDERYGTVDDKENIVKTFKFTLERLVPQSTYIASISLVRKDTGLKLGEVVSVEKQFIPAGANKYHSHLWKDGKFDLTKIDPDKIREKNPELVKSYQQMLAYNQAKNRSDVRQAQSRMEDINKCMGDSLDELQNKMNADIQERQTTKMVTQNSLREGEFFKEKQGIQNEQMRRIAQKIAEVEKEQGKKVSLEDISIRTLRSVLDGTILRLEEMNGEKKLVNLNGGCLAYAKNQEFGKMDDYGYLPCNIFDSEQHFNIQKINNIDEYNYLLSSNLKPKITEKESESVDYPFYTLHPDGSNKCVTMNPEGLQIKQCVNGENIQFKGQFAQDNCV